MMTWHRRLPQVWCHQSVPAPHAGQMHAPSLLAAAYHVRLWLQCALMCLMCRRCPTVEVASGQQADGEGQSKAHQGHH